MMAPEDSAVRDDLDRRIERGLRRLTNPGAEPFAVRDLLTPRKPSRRWAGWRAAMAAAASIALAIGAVFSIQTLRGTPSASPSSTSGVATGSSAPSSGDPADTPEAPVEVDVAAWMEAAWPAVIPGRFGTVDSTAYDRDPGTTLGHMPAVGGAIVEKWIGGPAVTQYVAVAGPRALADSTQLIVRGRPIAFSRPHFNAGDGSFWQNSLVGVVDGQSWAEWLQRDVLFQVDEVLGTTLPGGFEPGLVQFTVTAGQVVIDVPRRVPYAEGGDHALEAGRYLFGERPTADLRIGEEVVLFLRYGGNGGLYGDRYGLVRTLSPAHPLYYAFRVEGEGTKNLSEGGPTGDQWNASLDELRDIAASLAPLPDQPPADARVHPAKPTHDASEQPLPSPTPCPPVRIQGYWAGYSTLDSLLEETDLVIVARPTTRAREVTAQADDALVVLANDVLVEQVLAGDVTAGSLLPVERLAHRDPACPLIVDGNEPLQIDRPYLIALRRDGDNFILPEAPRALAEIRDGRLASSRWPELDGLTIAAARARLTISGGVDRLKADLEAARATVVELGTFKGRPFAGSDVRICVGGQQVDVYIYDSAASRVADAGLIDPDDPSHIGLAIVEWQGRPRFWQRDRIIVFYQGSEEATERVLTAVLGAPFAQSRVRVPGAFDASC